MPDDLGMNKLSEIDVQIGNPNSTQYSEQTPFYILFESSLSQTIYLASEINTSGMITHIKYRINSPGNMNNPLPVRIYFATTTVSSYPQNNSQIPFEQFTEVFQGSMDISSSGIYDVVFPLNNPFHYEGNNLVIMVLREFTNEYAFYNVWHYTNTPGQNRTIFAHDMYETIDPAVVHESSTRPDGIANITLTFQTGGLGALSGVVSHNSLPLEGVTVSIVGTNRNAISNSLGEYYITDIPAGYIDIVASKYMYIDKVIENLEIEANTTSVQDIEMTMIQHDLSAVSFRGPKFPVSNYLNKYTLRIHNEGGLFVDGSEYVVKFMQIDTGGDDITLSTLNGVDIASDTFKDFIFILTPIVVGEELDVYGLIIYEMDTNLENNKSDVISLTVQPEGQGYAYIGEPLSTNFNINAPLNYYYSSSVTQTIYLEEEIETFGLLTQLKYRFTGWGDILPNTQVKFYIATTELSSFTPETSWIPFEDFTLVFDGNLPVNTQGTYDVLIDLQYQYPYEGGNLVIMAHRLLSPYFDNTNRWQSTPISEDNRTIYVRSDWQAFDPSNLPPISPPDGAMITNVPNIGLSFIVGDVGILSGVVTHNGLPLSGVLVKVDGTERMSYTNENGEYLISYVPAGTIDITATKHGFIDNVIAGFYVVADVVNTLHISMEAKPVVLVSGTILASDTLEGLAGAKISLKGYEDYSDIITNSQGHFTIPSVYANFAYKLTVSREKYVTYVDNSVEIWDNDLVLPPITLAERANRPRNLLAKEIGNVVNLTWTPPEDTHETWFSHTSAQSGSFNVGTPDPEEYTVAHRYSVEQLKMLGLTDARLTKVAFMPGIAFATYAIKVWTAGSGEPLESGNLVYSGNAIHGSDLIGEDWNEIDLSTPITIPFNNELWIGYSIVTEHGGNAAVADSGPVLEGFSNLIYFDQWYTLTQLASEMTYNWMIKGYAEDAILGTTILGQQTSHLGATKQSKEIATIKSPNRDTFEIPPQIKVSSVSSRASHRTSALNIFESLNIKPKTSSQFPRSLLGYNIFRADVMDIEDPNAWVILETQINGNSYDDTGWLFVENGEYIYIVEAVYTDENISVPTFSNTVPKNMTSHVTINVDLNSSSTADGATVRLVNNNGNEEYTYQETVSGSAAIFPSVWIGSYTLTVTLNGYMQYQNDDLPIFIDTFSYDITLIKKEMLISENFEGADFPPLGWLLIDADGDDIDWAHSTTLSAYSGYGVAFSESFKEGVGALNPDNYLVTPPLNIPNAERAFVSFYVATQEISAPTETYSVMVSTTTPSIENFVTLRKETLNDSNVAWQMREVDLSDFLDSTIYLAFRHHDSSGNYLIKIDDVEIFYTGEIVSDLDPEIPSVQTLLRANFPNPFNPSTTILFDIATQGLVYIDIFNIKGQKIRNLVKDHYDIGNHSVVWNGTDDNGKSVASGIYFYQMTTTEFKDTKRMLLLK